MDGEQQTLGGSENFDVKSAALERAKALGLSEEVAKKLVDTRVDRSEIAADREKTAAEVREEIASGGETRLMEEDAASHEATAQWIRDEDAGKNPMQVSAEKQREIDASIEQHKEAMKRMRD